MGGGRWAAVGSLEKRLIDVLEWAEPDDETLVSHLPITGLAIWPRALLVVRDTQAALCVHEDRTGDLFGPGRHTIRTGNLPRHVYFFSTGLRLRRPWETAGATTIRDREFGAVGVRACGLYSYRITAPRTFFEQVSGPRESYAVADLEGQLCGTLVATLTEHLTDSAVPVLDMAADRDSLAATVRTKATAAFTDLGLGLVGLQIHSISLPAELQPRLEERIATLRAPRPIPVAPRRP